ncbi:LptF/LptG family permease [Alloprevotella sp. Lung230]|uniref:LptF/LptG family permease n=1 Tax=Alloprevotella sp. Lung230 TaxID=2766595 RepID=UPI002103DDEE|nr:LptF/LptG family permease [Alloprevotella sp. Lung230]
MDQTPTSRHNAHPFSDQEGMVQETALSTSELENPTSDVENPTSEPETAVFDTENPAATASELDTEDPAEAWELDAGEREGQAVSSPLRHWTLRWLLRLVRLPWLLVLLLGRMLHRSGRALLRLIGFKRIDRYILGKFLTTYVFLIAIFTVIAIIFDFNEKIDKLTTGGATSREIWLDYYANFIPDLANMLSPMFVFIGVIFFTTGLAGKSEIIAMKAAGMSFNRLLRPYLLGALIIAAISFAFGAFVIPNGNVARVRFENKYTKKLLVTDVADNIQMQVDTGVVAYISHFDNRTKSGSGFSLDKLAEKKVVSRLTAETIQYDTLANHKNSWTLHRYTIRTLQGSREKIESGEKLDTTLLMEPSDFFYIKGQEETMTLPQLSAFIDRQRLRGSAGLSTFEVAYHKRFATPMAAFILTLIGVSISIEKRKGGMGTSIGIGLALTFTYILLQTIAASFAINAGFPAGISVWMPNILFAFVAFGFYRRTPQ